MTDHCFTATIVEGTQPAKQQGMSGEYILLEFADWTQDSPTSLFEKNNELRGKSKDIIVMKEGVISKHNFKHIFGINLGIKHVDIEEKQRINEAYARWKQFHTFVTSTFFILLTKLQKNQIS